MCSLTGYFSSSSAQINSLHQSFHPALRGGWCYGSVWAHGRGDSCSNFIPEKPPPGCIAGVLCTEIKKNPNNRFDNHSFLLIQLKGTVSERLLKMIKFITCHFIINLLIGFHRIQFSQRSSNQSRTRWVQVFVCEGMKENEVTRITGNEVIAG